MIRFALQLLGGPYDGLRGLYWLEASSASGESTGPPPRLLHVGECTGDGECMDSRTLCRQAQRRTGFTGRHPAYWTEMEAVRPPRCVRYVMQGEPEVSGYREDGPLEGVALYVVGSQSPVSSFEVGATVDGPALAPVALARRWNELRERELDRLLPPGRHDRGWARG